ncbi:MAG TPA: KTSC domain-containing protein [Aridibacter sp.]|nr:KTSC domain-containing protein [Aridibacter sp.]
MNFKKINSSNLKSAGYDAENETLVVEFKSGDKYRYAPVPAELYKEFEKEFDGEDGRSAGRFFHARIRSLPFEKVEE